MTTSEETSRRFDKQDADLKKILDGMAEHREYHKLTDPGVSEMIDILKGAKGAKAVLSWLTAGAVAAASIWAWVTDHIRFLK